MEFPNVVAWAIPGFLGLLAVHVAEAFVFTKTLAAEDGAPAGAHVGKLLVFGYFHVMGVRYD